MDLGCPESIHKHYFSNINETVIVVKKSQSQALTFLILTIFWNIFISFFTVGLFRKDDLDIIEIIFAIPFQLLGLWLIYSTIILFINTIEIKVKNGQLSIKDTPLPLGNTKIVNINEIKQLYVNEKFSNSNESTIVFYNLMGITHNGKVIKIIKDLKDKEEALYLEQELEALLNIKPDTVKGEVT